MATVIEKLGKMSTEAKLSYALAALVLRLGGSVIITEAEIVGAMKFDLLVGGKPSGLYVDTEPREGVH